MGARKSRGGALVIFFRNSLVEERRRERREKRFELPGKKEGEKKNQKEGEKKREKTLSVSPSLARCLASPESLASLAPPPAALARCTGVSLFLSLSHLQ